MKIILKKDVLGLGYKDEVLTVKDGYGRNYLIPQGFAVLATPSAQKALEEEKKQRAHKIAKIKADAEAKAAQFEGVKLSITAKVSDGKNIYGSVGAPQLAEALAAMGLEVNPKQIAFKAVKELGSYVAPVHFHREVTVQIPFDVVNEEGLTTPKKEKVEEAPAVAETADAIDSIEDMEDLVEAEAEAEAKAEAEAEA
ncbi:MAG: 50S ribosomal protein L9 [Paludibacteraceae bacterium]|jgi:large subunit ribosomal protein L9|nr:50S ribosomal protein L9 [Paludibacteraceae bacterium]